MVCCVFIFICLMIFSNIPFDYPWLFKIVLFNFHIYVNFPIFLLLLTSSFISFHFTLFSEREPSESYPILCGTVVTLNNSILPSFSLFSMVPKHLECARPCQHSDSGEIEADVLGNPRKSDHWTCNTIFYFS